MLPLACCSARAVVFATLTAVAGSAAGRARCRVDCPIADVGPFLTWDVRGVLRAVQQPGRDRLDQEEAEHGDDQGGQHQGGRDHPQLQRTVPAAA